MLRLLYTQATTAAQSAPSRVPMPVSAPTRRLLHDGPKLAMAQPRAHPCDGAVHLPTIYNAREFVEAGGVMSYGPNASDSVPALGRGREGGGQQAVSSLNESTFVPCAKCVQQNSAHSRESGNPGQGPGSLQRGPRDANVAGCPSRGRGERGGFCRYEGTKIPIHPL